METFINPAIDNGIRNYLNSSNNQSVSSIHLFELHVIKMLVSIYGEINIINPYKLQDEKSFTNNLKLYGLNDKELNEFFKKMEYYDEWLNHADVNSKNDIINSIEKILIDMIMLKSTSINILPDAMSVYDEFFDPVNTELNTIQEHFSNDPTLIPRIWKRKKNRLKNNITFEEIAPNLLTPEQYLKYGVTMKEIKQLSNSAISRLNKKILEEESQENAHGGRKNTKPLQLVLTSGSGFVDTIVLLSVITTEIMVGLIIAFSFVRG